MINKPLRAICGSPDRPLKIGDVEIPCYVIEKDGKPVRVLSGRGVQGALALGQSHGTKLKGFLAKKEIKLYSIFEFRRQG